MGCYSTVLCEVAKLLQQEDRRVEGKTWNSQVGVILHDY